MNSQVYSTPFGLLEVELDSRGRKIIRAELLAETNREITGEDLPIHLPVKLRGTAFQLLVWRELLKIPLGETRTYSQIAQQIGQEKSYRAVAQACGQNKIIFFVPCHRVVSKSGLGGFKYGLAIKRALLDHEEAPY